jgi:aspartate kinase
MIVMKFGGTSVESSDAIGRLVGIVRSHIARQPIVVVSAMGKTTNMLLDLAEDARRGDLYRTSTRLDELQNYHFDVAGQVADGETLEQLEISLQRSFRDLRVILSEVADEGREVTPALLDEIASFGERMSSEIVASALESGGVPSIHLDARSVILTDDRHTQARPLCWETYANLRRVIPYLSEHHVVVMGGFIGATKDGVTTTLGRGGSDLTASIVGAGVCADEIQIWTDVDGMLTCDPRVLESGFRLKSISYQEAEALARAGAKVLHPDTVAPAVRQRIPLVIRNSRRPAQDGTRIVPVAPPCSNHVKAIACKSDLLVLEVFPKEESSREALAAALTEVCARHGMPAEFVCQKDGTIFLALKSSARYENLPIELDGCVEVRLHPQSAILTLVGTGIDESSQTETRVLAALKQIPVKLLSGDRSSLAVSIMIPAAGLRKAVEELHHEFFQQIDPAVFADCRVSSREAPVTVASNGTAKTVTATRYRPLTAVSQN